MIEFADVSFYQGSIDFDKMKLRPRALLFAPGRGCGLITNFQITGKAQSYQDCRALVIGFMIAV